MIKVDQIKEKVELKDMEINADPCKFYWEDYGEQGKIDCNRDCTYCGSGSDAPNYCAYGSDKY